MVEIPNPVLGKVEMRYTTTKALGVLTALCLFACLVTSDMVLDSGSSYAAGPIKWTKIPIPDEGDMQLHLGYDTGAMAISPDGTILFTAVQNESSGKWSLLKSADSAFTWQQMTGLSNAMAARIPADTSQIVAVKCSPSWSSDGTMFVATNETVYFSEDRGGAFTAMVNVSDAVVNGSQVIDALDLGSKSGGIVVVVGTYDPGVGVGGDVYVYDSNKWVAQAIGAYDVLAVGLSPSYATDTAIVAVATDAANTRVTAKLGAGAWGGAVFNATSNLHFASSRACIRFPDDYVASGGASGMLTLFIGLSNTSGLGDVFRIHGGWLSSSTVTDLNIRGYEDPDTQLHPTKTNIWSLAASGSYSNSSVVLIAGTDAVNAGALPTPPGQLLVYTSADSGATWEPNVDDYLGYKQPTGEARATVVMTQATAYVGTSGNQSGVSAALYAEGSSVQTFFSWNQRGLIDTAISEITDIQPSQAYSADGTIYMTTRDANPLGDTSLWRTRDSGNTWERIYCSTLTGPMPCIFDIVRLISGGDIVVAQGGGKTMVPSLDNGVTFQNTRGLSLMENISSFIIAGTGNYYVGGANGSVEQTTDAGATWVSSLESDIPLVDTVVDLVLGESGFIYAGTDHGGVYKDSGDFAFVRVGPGAIGGAGDVVCTAPDLYEGFYLYAGIRGGAGGGIYRFDQSDDEAIWEKIADIGDITALVSDEQTGILYAISTTTETAWRCINPTATKETPLFEEMKNGLDVSGGNSVRRSLRLTSDPAVLFAVGGASYTQLWMTRDEISKTKLLAPEDGSIAGTILEDQAYLGRAVLMLEWKEVERAEIYEVDLAFDEELKSPVDASYYEGGTSLCDGAVKVVYPWLGTRYYWRVRVVDPYMGRWSDTWSFVTPLGPAPSIPELRSPQGGQKNVMLRPVLQWNSSLAATGYELMLAPNCDFTNPVLNLSGENAIIDTAYQLTVNLAKNTSYCWRVRAVNEITHSLWSDTGSFTTGFTAEPEAAILPMWIWVIIALGAVFMLSILVLIMQSRKY